MYRSRLRCVGVFCLCILTISAPRLFAQDGSSVQAPAQTASASQPAVPGTAASLPLERGSAGAGQPAKKIWTNSDVQDLRADSPISTIGESNAPKAAANSMRTTGGTLQNQKWYVEEITRLQAKLPPIDKKIANLQAAISGKFTGDSQSSTRPSGAHFGDWSAQLSQLQKRRADIESQIDALHDHARQAGIAPNSLP